MHRTICDYVLDLVENSVEAGSSVISVSLSETESLLRLRVEDNGKGMSDEETALAIDPFYSDFQKKHPERKVGLGLSFAAQTASEIGGEFSIDSQVSVGTLLELSFPLDNIDCPPTGELPSTLAALFGFGGSYELRLHRVRKGREYTISRSDFVRVLGSIDDVGARGLIQEYLASCEDELQRGENDGQDEFGRVTETAAEQTT
ncbi:MAG TPA: ATP-binding protein [Spirochaetia bacterium]|nr:ATP-binding protein [Spirochaetia bacterium]